MAKIAMQLNAAPAEIQVAVSGSGNYISLRRGGVVVRFHAIWLRDNAADSRTRSVHNGQRLIEKLSEASVYSLNLQGGPMDESEISVFEQQPNLERILGVRIYDDQGKDPDMETPGFASYLPMLQRILDSNCRI